LVDVLINTKGINDFVTAYNRFGAEGWGFSAYKY